MLNKNGSSTKPYRNPLINIQKRLFVLTFSFLLSFYIRKILKFGDKSPFLFCQYNRFNRQYELIQPAISTDPRTADLSYLLILKDYNRKIWTAGKK